MDIIKIRRKLEQLKGQKSQVEDDLKALTHTVRQDTRNLKKYEQAKVIIREVGLKTQERLQFHISDITSLALGAVFPNPYTLEVEFIQRRNKTECDIYFVRDGNRVDPLASSGYGAVDIASFALRIASWSLQMPRTRNVIILDEPMRFVSKNLIDKASAMIKEVSNKLGIQFIIITHEPKLAAYADKIFEVSIKDGISQVSAKEQNE